MYFPPAFFDVMLHLLVHIVSDIEHLGPAFLHNMFPFERMNGWVKGFIRNMAHLDGSTMQGFLTEECISFCMNYMDVKNSIGVPINKHKGRVDGVGHSNLKKELHVGHTG